jgi:hypothetical protein
MPQDALPRAEEMHVCFLIILKDAKTASVQSRVQLKGGVFLLKGFTLVSP